MTTGAVILQRPFRRPRPWLGWAGTFLALMQRDTRVLRREFIPFLLRTLMQPFMFVFVFAYLLPKIGEGSRSFGDILVPGLIGSSIFLQGIQAVALPLVQEFSQTKEIEDRVMAPLPVAGVAVEKIVFAFLQALLSALVVFPLVYIIPLSRPHLHVDVLVLLTVLPLAAIVSASLGLLIGTVVGPRQIPLVFSLIVIPVVFLGAVYYPWAQLHSLRWLQVLVLVNPLVYVSEGLRAALTPQYGHMHYLAVYIGLGTGAAVCTYLGIRRFVSRVLS
jgi:ABC-2 type transport system permease protein